MKVEKVNVQNSCLASETKIGDLMVMENGTIFLHTYGGFVNLNNARLTYNEGLASTVRLFNPGESVTLTQE